MKKSDSRLGLGRSERTRSAEEAAAAVRPCAVTLINYWRQDREQLFLFINITGDDDDGDALSLPRSLVAPLVRLELL